MKKKRGGGGFSVEFWLDEHGDSLAVRDLEGRDSHQGGSTWTHVLFGAAWCGNVATVKELHKRLLVPYFYKSGVDTGGRDIRSDYLEEMERDALQYRLMHKGYARFFPERGGIHTPHGDAIDQDSVFWDSGYRRTATRLFASRVFLPRLKN